MLQIHRLGLLLHARHIPAQEVVVLGLSLCALLFHLVELHV